VRFPKPFVLLPSPLSERRALITSYAPDFASYVFGVTTYPAIHLLFCFYSAGACKYSIDRALQQVVSDLSSVLQQYASRFNRTSAAGQRLISKS
jgi:hypothetical protein